MKGFSVRESAIKAKAAARELALLSSAARAEILIGMAAKLELAKAEILAANQRDLENATSAGISPAMLDRLTLNEDRFASMISGVRQVAALPDPTGELIESSVRPNGLRIEKVRVPLGLIAVIYESRPNVTIDTAALCLRVGNAIYLRGGSEAKLTNSALVKAAVEGAEAAGLPVGALVADLSGDRALVNELVQLEGVVDLVIPRGGEGLIRAVTAAARVPVLKHYKGVCHVYVDSSADLTKAAAIVINSKCQRPGVCNALETLLVDQKVAAKFLPSMCQALVSQGVELRGDVASRHLYPAMIPASEEDWASEYLDLILSIRVVDGVEEAVRHIEQYGSRHSDSIVAEDVTVANRFLAAVDSAVVYVNASTRFTDGSEFGLGAEIGISTDKLHARGPMGLRELTTYKYLVHGDGQIR